MPPLTGSTGTRFLALALVSGSSFLADSYGAALSQQKLVVFRAAANRLTVVHTYDEPRAATTGTSTATAPTSGGGGQDGVGTATVYEGVRARLDGVHNGAAPRESADALPPSQQFDTATISLTNLGSSTYQAVSNAQAGMVGTDGHLYYPDEMHGVANCTDFSSGGADGTISIPAGRTQTGCVHFVVPHGVLVREVAYSPVGAIAEVKQEIVWKV